MTKEAIKTLQTLVVVIIIGMMSGCGASDPVRTANERELLRTWSGATNSVQERAVAIDKYLAIGTPMSSVIDLLGTNYELQVGAIVNTGRSVNETAFDVIYNFGSDSVSVAFLAPLGEPFSTGRFNGVRYSTSALPSADGYRR